jgi:hypothetical protein
MMRPSYCWTFAPIRLLSDVVELPLTVVCSPANVRLPSPRCTCLSAGADPDLSCDSCWRPLIEAAEVKRSGVSVVDRGEPEASYPEWHGDGPVRTTRLRPGSGGTQRGRRVRPIKEDTSLVARAAGPRQPVLVVGYWMPAGEWAERLPQPTRLAAIALSSARAPRAAGRRSAPRPQGCRPRRCGSGRRRCPAWRGRGRGPPRRPWPPARPPGWCRRP